jgi:UDP-4-amino-4-deoxy-L-arabinose-oxoglutarate aminotransferase
MKVQFYRHNIDATDIQNVTKVLKGIFLTTGEWVSTFEEKFADYLGLKYALGLTSCTEALQLALMAYGIGRGDEVITTPMSFIATSNAIEVVGARPVFVDIEEETGNINIEAIEQAITPRTKAILPVHLYGQLCDMNAIQKIARKHRLRVIEDAAHALESKRDGYGPGQRSDMACFSFYATKSITCGEGGAIVLSDNKKAEWLKKARLHGMKKGAEERFKLGKFQHQSMEFLGLKANMSNIQASLLLHQLERADERLHKKELLARRYDKIFENHEKIKPVLLQPNSISARHVYVVRVPSKIRDRVIVQMAEKGVGVASNYLPIPHMDYYRKKYGYKKGDFPRAERWGAEVISLPLYAKLKKEEQNHVIRSLLEVVEGSHKGRIQAAEVFS